MSSGRRNRRRAGAPKKRERNDRIVAVESGNHSYARVRRINDLGKTSSAKSKNFL